MALENSHAVNTSVESADLTSGPLSQTLRATEVGVEREVDSVFSRFFCVRCDYSSAEMGLCPKDGLPLLSFVDCVTQKKYQLDRKIRRVAVALGVVMLVIGVAVMWSRS